MRRIRWICSLTRSIPRSCERFPPARDWLASVKPDVAVISYNDHGLNFFLDKMPDKVRQRRVNDHIPVSNTASGLLVLEPI
jgi:hypothetical protein